MRWEDRKWESTLEDVPGALGNLLRAEIALCHPNGHRVVEEDLLLDDPVVWHWRVGLSDWTVCAGFMDERGDAKEAAQLGLSCLLVRLHEQAVALNTATHALPRHVPMSPQARANLEMIRGQVADALDG